MKGSGGWSSGWGSRRNSGRGGGRSGILQQMTTFLHSRLLQYIIIEPKDLILFVGGRDG